MELRASFSFMQEILDSLVDTSGVSNFITKQDQMHGDICITAKKIVAFSYFIDRVVFVKDLDGN
jgi:hypothetical protein